LILFLRVIREFYQLNLKAGARTNFVYFFSAANALIINTSEEYSVIKVITEAIKKLPAALQDTTINSLNAKKIRKPGKASTGIVMHNFFCFYS
jgi:hypothetical protein